MDVITLSFIHPQSSFPQAQKNRRLAGLWFAYKDLAPVGGLDGTDHQTPHYH
jgi:hypothetical protein